MTRLVPPRLLLGMRAEVPKVFFWTTIKKNRTKYSQSRCASEDQVYNILFEHIVLAKNVDKAETALLEVPGLKRFFGSLKSPKEKEDFRKHMRKYISIWLPDCPFEVSTTNRYTITQHEASTTARHKIPRGEIIKYLCGNLVAMTPEEEKELDLNRRDFSVVKQQRKKTSSLFLGPARFSNHDCKANSRLCQQGDEGMTIVAMRDIAIGEEVTVDYGDHYFGTNNQDCLCVTCEGKARNGWAPLPPPGDAGSKNASDTPGTSRDSSLQSGFRKRGGIPDADIGHGRRSKRSKRNTGGAGHLGLATPEATDKSSPRSDEDVYDLPQDDSDGELDRDFASGVDVGLKHLQTISPNSFYGSKKSQNSASRATATKMSQKPVDTTLMYVNMWLGGESKPKEEKSAGSIWKSSGYLNSSLGTAPSVFPGDNLPFDDGDEDVFGSSTSPTHWARPGLTPSSSSAHSLLHADFDDSQLGSASRARKGRPVKPFNKLSASTRDKYARHMRLGVTPDLASKFSPNRQDPSAGRQSRLGLTDYDSDTEAEDYSGERMDRTPGDYVRTKLLLPVPASLWCDCMTCHNTWVQNSDEMKRECPRCERHSKLYGFRWPKTEKKKGDTEERITDHRLINRALSHRERKEMGGKRGRGLNKPENADTSIDYSDGEAEDDGARRLRNTQARAGQLPKTTEIDRQAIENSDKRIVKGKGWYMMVDT